MNGHKKYFKEYKALGAINWQAVMNKAFNPI